jgi:hypothetical protein
VISSQQAHDFVERRARIRVHSGAEGTVISYCAAPSLTIEHDDGSRSSWSVDLPINEVEPPGPKATPYRVYSRWARAGDTSRRAVYDAIQEAYAAGLESRHPSEGLSHD